MNRAPGRAWRRAGAVALLALTASPRALARDGPSEDELFGGTSPAPAESPNTGPAAEKPASDDGSARSPADAGTPVAPAADDREAQILGGGGTPMPLQEAAPSDPLQIGGQLYLRSQSTALEGQPPRNWSFNTPFLLDVYFDARPNERVRAYALGRMSFDSTLPSGTIGSGSTAVGGTAGSPSLDALFRPQSGSPRVTLDQLWLRFDIAHRVFVTAGKLHARWGTGRFWAPTDYLHVRRRNPLDVFDARSGTTMLKLHVPIEAKAWNFYGYAITEGTEATSTVDRVAAAARAEFVFGSAELGLGALFQRHRAPKLGADLSMGIGDFDVYGEFALRDGGEIDRVQFAPNAVVPPFGEPPSWETPAQTAVRELEQVVDTYYPVHRSNGIKEQVVGGFSYSHKYNDSDTFTLGGEYFYNGLGHRTTWSYPGLMLPHSFELADAVTFYYLGKHYAAIFLALPAPYSLDAHSFTLTTLGNLSDRSFITRLDYSFLMLTHLRLEAFASARYGNESGEFRLGVSTVGLGGYNFSRAPAIADFGAALRLSI